MKANFKSLPFLLLLALHALPAEAQNRCSRVHFKMEIGLGEVRADQRLSNLILGFGDVLGTGSTTSLRQEDKFVVRRDSVDGVLARLSQDHPRDFQLRDQKNPGQKNVTVTQYALPVKFFAPNGRLISAKIRFRKYYETSESVPLGDAPMTPVGFVRDRQFVEFKIDHPEYNQVVLKPRMIVLDSDVALIQKRETYRAHASEIMKRVIQMNPKTDPAVIRRFFEIFSEFYGGTARDLPFFAETTYVRDSYSLMLKDLQGKSVEIQLTVDREVKVIDSRDQHSISAYAPSDVVVELKIPLAYAQLRPQDLAQVPGLAQVLELKKELEVAHQAQFQLGAGKLSTFQRVRAMTDPLISD